MLSFPLQGQRFQVRAAAIVIDAGFVLLHRAPGDAYWALPGGRVELGEQASATIERELREELGLNVRCGPLLHIAENFFDNAGRRNHEIGFYFMVELPAGPRYRDKSIAYRGIEDDAELEFRWFALTELAAINLRPTFLQQSLVADPPVFSHAVQREESTLGAGAVSPHGAPL